MGFQQFDEDGSGFIEFPEFVRLLHKLLKIPKTAELPANRLNMFWKEIDADGSGSVCADEFLTWFIRYFDVKGNSDVSPIEHLPVGAANWKINVSPATLIFNSICAILFSRSVTNCNFLRCTGTATYCDLQNKNTTCIPFRNKFENIHYFFINLGINTAVQCRMQFL